MSSKKHPQKQVGHSSHKEDEDRKALGIILLGFAMVLAYYGLEHLPGVGVMSGASLAPDAVVATPNLHERRVNQHLLSVDMRRQLERDTMAVENNLKAPSLRNTKKEYRQYFEGFGVSLDQEGREELVSKDLDPRGFNPTYADTPHDDVQSRLLDQQIAEQEYQRRLAEAKQRAIEKARREGYLIELDDNMVVTSSRKLPQSRTPQSSGGDPGPNHGKSLR